MRQIEFINEQQLKNEIGIYRIVNKVNGLTYVGQTKEKFQRRYWLHRWELRNNTHDNGHLQNSWNKYGENNFYFEVVEICQKEEIDDQEIYWIKYFRNHGGAYNIQDGGQPENLNDYVTPEMRKLIGEKNRQRLLGCKLSEETKKKMSITRKGKRVHTKRDTLTDEQASKIKQMLIDGMSSKQIMEITHSPYKSINAILSNNAYSTVIVEGWDNFYREHLLETRYRKERGLKIIEDLKLGKSVNELAEKYSLNRKTIEYYKKKI